MSRLIQLSSLLLILLPVISGIDCGQMTRKAPYLIFNGSGTEMQVLWQLNSSDTCRIEWGTDTHYSVGSARTAEYDTNHQHTYIIKNLSPARKYYYRVNIGGEVDNGTFYSAPDSSAEKLCFFAYGDTRTNPDIHNRIANAIVKEYRADPDYQSLIICVGDLVADGDVDSLWDSEFFAPSYSGIQNMLGNIPYQSCMGNHEASGELFKMYFPYPYVNGHYWSFNYGPAHFIAVDQYSDYGPGSAELKWLENDLASTTKRWKFIYLHEPGWSAGDHPNDKSVQDYIQPLCTKYGVQIVFGGHNHYYARAVVDNVQHITTGGGGAPLYKTDPGFPHLVKAVSENHFCKIEIDRETLKFQAVTSSGGIIDSFTIVNPLPDN